ncbi:MAG: zinc-binding dehydrogenase [Ardenticatenaceae bacterium]|nr:zinc-binding dehydrogenase [Anaerolineales bacterium]MCB8922412.1 zinc-binding dehydrogenase [Ardenticatenaceae bacterium]MCB8991344.1 zinc-binding dehydrogenase [Ardenticatenaceae bacterium]
MTYKSVVATKRGGPDALQIIENELRPPAAGEVRVKIQAVPVCQDDVAVRVGKRPFLPKLPFTPGYSILGLVDAVGEGVTGFAVGDRVAALTSFGGYAEMIYWPADKLVHIPASLDAAETVTLILNYLVAYQILHRVAQVKTGDKVLIIGASGGVGTAFLQLGQLAGLRMFGLASPGKHQTLMEYGAVPIDYHTQDFVEVIRQTEPDGLDFVFNGMGEEVFGRGLAVLRRGGRLIHYGGPESFGRFLLLVLKLIFYNLLPNGKKIVGYGTHRLGVELFQEDWTALFKLLEAGEIKPLIAAKFPILEARKANELLESGGVVGNIVLLSPELL